MLDVDQLNADLNGISKSLQIGSLNYSANLKIWEANNSAGKSAGEIVRAALGATAVLGGTFAISEEDAISEILGAFLFAGDDGAHPGQKTLSSERYKKDVSAVMERLRAWIESSSLLIGIWLKEGHPFYPVFWDYAYIVESGSDCHVIIASASD